jgi:hypothetical protein
MAWLKNVLVAIDQLGNAIAGGNPDLTISARVGYHISTDKGAYWISLQKVIDFTFYPLDGPGHCLQSYRADIEDYKDESGSDVARAMLGGIIVIACAGLCVLTRIIAIFK